jgi:hypothetical protein
LALCTPALAPAHAAAASAAGEEAEKRAYWQERARETRDTLRQAQRRHRKANAAYQEMLIRNRPRGEKKAAVIAEREEAEAALDAARRAMEALSEEARRAGALPGWIRLDP